MTAEGKHAVGTPRLAEFRKEISELLRARFGLVQIATFEEERALREIEEIARQLSLRVFYWSASRGVFTAENDPKKKEVDKSARLGEADLAVALELFESYARKDKSSLFILIDPYPYLSSQSANPVYRRRLRDFAISIRTRGYHANCLIVSPTVNIPLELEKEISVVDFPLPERDEVRRMFESTVKKLENSGVVSVADGADLVNAFVDASLGLTHQEIESALSRAIIDDRRLDFNDVEKIFRQKQFIVRKSGILDYVDVRGQSVSQIGGLDALKEWLSIRDAAFSDAGREYGIATPKGVLLTGVPGCGKSLSAKCVAASWRLPLIRLDLGKVYSKWVGSSEEHIRAAIATCESIAPCVLWIDEIEKGLPRSSGQAGDSGVSLRVFGSFLTWLQEKTAPVFVFATANQIDLLPPEILRKGRFDEIFFVDLPNDEERREILNIHIKRAGRDPARFDLDELVRISGEGQFGPGVMLTGAEIESWVNESLIAAFNRKQKTRRADVELEMADFRSVVGRIVPLGRMRQEEIRGMRDWAKAHAVHASQQAGTTEEPAGVVVGGRRIDI